MGPPHLAIPADLDASIVLLRHGESTHIAEGRFQGQADSPLSALGERQARLAAARLAAPARPPALPIADRRPVEIVHSPLLRAARTARLVAEAVASDRPARGSVTAGSAALRPEPRLVELAQGSWEGSLRADVEARDAALLAAWRHHPLGANAPGGERVADAAVRARAALADVVARLAAAGSTAPTRRAAEPGGQVSGYPAPAHDDAPWTLLVGHDGIFKVALLTLLDVPLESFWAFPFALCGITVVELRAGRGVLRAHNLVEHLAPLTGPAGDVTDASAWKVAESGPAAGREESGAL